MDLLKKCEDTIARRLVMDKALKIVEEASNISSKLWELQFFPNHVRDALAFLIVVCHMNHEQFFEFELDVIFEELDVSYDLVQLAADHWAGLHNRPLHDNLKVRIMEMTSFFFGEQESIHQETA